MKPTARSVRGYRPGAARVAIVAGLATILGVLASPGGASPKLDASPTPGPRRIGMNSCAARGCHGAVDSTDPARGQVYIKDGAYTTWLNYDPHARAYAVLLEPRSKAMAARLRGPLEGKSAHEAGLCLSCHSTTGPPEARTLEAVPLREGITCEACHGPAEVWQDKHLAPSWRDQPALRKALDGLTDLESPASRARACVGCHVGDRSRGMDMNHDLIAAGHPRLNFEFASYLASYPKHWKEAYEKAGLEGSKVEGSADFEAKSWSIGQVVTARAVLGLLADRAEASKEGVARKPPAPEAVWPEFSEYECFRCHHGLASPSPYQVSGHGLGQLPWGTWPSAMLPELARGRAGVDLEAWPELRAAMSRPSPDPDRVIELAAQARGQLDALLRSLESDPVDPVRIASMLKALAATPGGPSEGWDQLAQSYLALQALARASKDAGRGVGPEVEAAILRASKALDFPPNYDSPRSVSPALKSESSTQPLR